MARHSIVRSPRCWALAVSATPKGVMEVTMAGREGSQPPWPRWSWAWTRTSICTWLCSFGPVGPSPGSVDCADDRDGLPKPPLLGGRLRARAVRRRGGDRQLWRWARPPLQDRWDTSGMEVERPKKRHLRRNGKSDPLDAEAAARAVLAGETAGEPKGGEGRVEMIRALRTARHSAVKARSQAINQLQALVVTAPETLRKRLRGLSTRELVGVAARFRLGSDPADVQTATRFALRSVARRHQQLSEEIAELDEQLDRLVAEVAPGLVSLPAVGTSHAATLLSVAGDNTERLSSEASFASLLCGVSPIEASSGKVVRHRLNRGGDREANRALHLIC